MKGCIAIVSFVFEVVMSWGGIIGRREGILFANRVRNYFLAIQAGFKAEM